MNDPTKIYEQRVVAFVDILGWSKACETETIRLANAAQAIHDTANDFNKDTKEKIKNIPDSITNPMFLEVQVGAFSDNFAISMPASFGHRILSAASNVCRKLLQQGFLTRGGITVGNLHHIDNIIFGPALTEAVGLEKEAVFPRLVCSPQLIEHLGTFPSEMWTSVPIITDQLGREIANIFELGFGYTDGRPIIDFAKEFWGIPKIESLIEQELQKFSALKKDKEAEKWRYMRDVLPIMLQPLKVHSG